MYNKKSIGERIKKIRLQSGKTQETFGKEFGASKGNVAMWEKGATLPNAERLNNISEFAGISVNQLLFGKEYSLNILKKMQEEDFSKLKSLLYNNIKDFIIRYYDVEDSIYFNLDIKKVSYFKRLYGRLILNAEKTINENDESLLVQKANDKLVYKFTNIMLKDISEVDINHYDSRNEYIKDLANYLSYDDNYQEHFFDYLIFICERISKNYDESLKFMLNKQVSNLISKINDILYDFDKDENNDDFYKIYNKITNNNKLINKNSLVDIISFDEYKEIIQQLNYVIDLIENIGNK